MFRTPTLILGKSIVCKRHGDVVIISFASANMILVSVKSKLANAHTVME